MICSPQPYVEEQLLYVCLIPSINWRLQRDLGCKRLWCKLAVNPLS